MNASLATVGSAGNLRRRSFAAAQACAGLSCDRVVLHGTVDVAGIDLASLFTGMGIEVFHGPQGLAANAHPLLVISTSGLQQAGSRHLLEISRRLHPLSAICVVTGGLTDCVAADVTLDAEFDDARAGLRAAGIGFISETGGSDATHG